LSGHRPFGCSTGQDQTKACDWLPPQLIGKGFDKKWDLDEPLVHTIHDQSKKPISFPPPSSLRRFQSASQKILKISDPPKIDAQQHTFALRA
jgi:hypothetical protein